MRLLILSLFIAAFLYGNAQDEKANYINKIMGLCPDADIIEIETKEDYVEVEYLCGNTIVETGLSFDLKIIYTESETTIDDRTLFKIQKKLDKRYYGWTIDEFALVEMPDTSFYKAEILHDGVEENVYFTLDGKYYKTKNRVLNESWNITLLEKNERYNKSTYNLTLPNKTYEMPEILIEISGIAVSDESDIFCIQDEAGIVFRYNLKNEEINKMYRFTDIGDFEDITIVDDKLNILRSDGTIFSIASTNFTGASDSRVLPLNCMDIEGLFYDKVNSKYLIACKDQLINEKSSLRHVFSIEKNGSEQPKIELVIDLNEINKFFKDYYPEIDAKVIQLNPSAISVHPLSGEIFVLSASNRLLAIYKNSQLKDIYPLAEELFYKPEGLSFTENGDMFISSEGNKKGYTGGQIHYFKWGK
jgi:hypothetical protein